VYERQYYDGKVEASYPTQGLLAEELKKQISEVQFASGLEYASAPGTQNTFEANGKINNSISIKASLSNPLKSLRTE
jgi:hypothetical protein